MYSHEPVSFDVINAKDTEELELLPELSTTSLSNVRLFHRHLFIHISEDLVQSWKSQTGSPAALDCHSTGQPTPDEDMPQGRALVLVLSVNAVLLHHFLLLICKQG